MHPYSLLVAAILAGFGAACSKPEATCANAAGHVVNLLIKEAGGEARAALRAKKGELKTTWCESNAAATKEQFACVLDKQSLSEAGACVAAAPPVVDLKAGGGVYGGGTADVPPVPDKDTPAPNPLTQIPAAPDAGTNGAKPLSADAIPQGDVRTFGRGDPAAPPPTQPVETADKASQAECETLAKHVVRLMMDTPEMEKLDEETRKQMTDMMKDIEQSLIKMCLEGGIPPAMRSCLMAAKSQEDIKKCE